MQRSAALEESTHAEPYFSAQRVYVYYFQDSTASSHQTYQTCPECVSQGMPSNCAEVIEFDLSAIAPGTIKNVLKWGTSNSSPGEDGIHTTIWRSYLLLIIFWQSCPQRSYLRTILPQNPGARPRLNSSPKAKICPSLRTFILKHWPQQLGTKSWLSDWNISFATMTS